MEVYNFFSESVNPKNTEKMKDLIEALDKLQDHPVIEGSFFSLKMSDGSNTIIGQYMDREDATNTVLKDVLGYISFSRILCKNHEIQDLCI